MFEKAQLKDLDRLMEIYEHARAFMRSRGNKNQWINGYPSRELLSDDISKGQLFVYKENDEILGVFAFILGDDPTYGYIEGAWHSAKPYGTIHRIACIKGGMDFLKLTADWCLGTIDHLRADTHADNGVMQKALLRYGFKEAGVIYLLDGAPRLAYDYLK